jgi:hypothetical protein
MHVIKLARSGKAPARSRSSATLPPNQCLARLAKLPEAPRNF